MTCKDCIKYDACHKFKTCAIPCEDCQLIREHCFMSDDYAKYCDCYINKTECQKVVHAKWMKNIDSCGWHCSVCGKGIEQYYAQPYCSECGAKMDLE